MLVTNTATSCWPHDDPLLIYWLEPLKGKNVCGILFWLVLPVEIILSFY